MYLGLENLYSVFICNTCSFFLIILFKLKEMLRIEDYHDIIVMRDVYVFIA